MAARLAKSQGQEQKEENGQEEAGFIHGYFELSGVNQAYQLLSLVVYCILQDNKSDF
jgi:hypothetical protein